jgi:hypothetical protein
LSSPSSSHTPYVHNLCDINTLSFHGDSTQCAAAAAADGEEIATTQKKLHQFFVCDFIPFGVFFVRDAVPRFFFVSWCLIVYIYAKQNNYFFRVAEPNIGIIVIGLMG